MLSIEIENDAELAPKPINTEVKKLKISLPLIIKKKKAKKPQNQVIGMDQVRLISMVLHFQKKIGLKLTGNIIHEK